MDISFDSDDAFMISQNTVRVSDGFKVDKAQDGSSHMFPRINRKALEYLSKTNTSKKSDCLAGGKVSKPNNSNTASKRYKPKLTFTGNFTGSLPYILFNDLIFKRKLCFTCFNYGGMFPVCHKSGGRGYF